MYIVCGVRRATSPIYVEKAGIIYSMTPGLENLPSSSYACS